MESDPVVVEPEWPILPMLDRLRRIVQLVSDAPNLQAALESCVSQVKKAVGADVCSIYLTDTAGKVNVLQATDGYRRNATGAVRIPLDQGLVGLVWRQAESINLDDAPQHPAYIFTDKTGEDDYHGFVGVPITQNRSVLGVLVVRQRESRKFDENEVTFLFTLAAQLSGAIVNARERGELAALNIERREASWFLVGRSGIGGVALGEVVVAYPEADLAGVPDRPAGDPEVEEDSLRVAIASVKEDLYKLKHRLTETLPTEDQVLFDALILMLDSDTLIDDSVGHIRAGIWAPGALRQTIEDHARVFDNMEDAYLRERASDVRDLGRRVLTYLNQDNTRVVEYPENTILIGEDVSAVQLAEVPVGKLAGVVSARGSSSSHVAILAKALGVPAIMGVSNLPVGRIEGRRAIIDGYRARLHISPQPKVWEEYARIAKQEQRFSDELEAIRPLANQTLDGEPISLLLNSGLLAEMTQLSQEMADGVGLYRTELPFMVRDRFPGEEEQANNYRVVLEAFDPRPVTLRTLDIGGDKPLSYFPIEESNPFLGWRGIRISLDHPEIFTTQLRAMLLASVGLDNLRIMFPMVSNVHEVDEAISLLKRAYSSLREEQLDIRMPRIGVMMEVPSAVYQTRVIARRVDFLSVGTNDLTQYLLAVDRNNANVGDLYNDFHPAVLGALMQIMDGARAEDREVSICGELAGSPLAVPLLLGMGVRHFSMSSGSLLRAKWIARSMTVTECRDLLDQALECEDGQCVRELMQTALRQRGLGEVLQPTELDSASA